MAEVDALVIAAHPDDAEMICGGTIAKITDRGGRVVIADMTAGEMGTRGTPETRTVEATAAAKVLGVTDRRNLQLPDGRLENTEQARIRVVELIRDVRPKLVMSHYWEDLHPDHAATGHIVKDTMYTNGFVNYPANGEPWRPHEYLFFMAHFPFDPSFVVDIDGYHETKMQSVRCYESQLNQGDADDKRKTLIAQPGFLNRLEARARFYGSQIYREFGEPFLSRRAIPVTDPVQLYEPFGKF